MNRFVASDITSVVFSDDPAFEPNRHDQPTIDTVRFAESENGTAGPATPLRSWLRTEANPAATDTLSLVIRNSSGSSVASLSGSLDGGNIQSSRLKH